MKEKQKISKNKREVLMHQAKGITLIALVVTIIVLLILAGIALNLTIGQNGIITRAQTAVIVNENASVYEQLQMIVADYSVDKFKSGNNEVILERLKNDGYVNEENIVNVTNLMKRSMKTGNGKKETGDVYVLEQMQTTDSSENSDTSVEDMDYYLIYYSKENNSTNLGLAFNGNIKENLVPTGEEWFEFDEETGAIAIIDSDDYYTSYITKRELGLEKIIVPEIYQGKKVTSIGINYSRSGGNPITLGLNVADVKKIILPDSIEIINDGISDAHGGGTGAFASCTSLQEIKLSSNLKRIGKLAFLNCISLESIEIPESVTEIGEDAFLGCTNLKTIYINNINILQGDFQYAWGAENAKVKYKPYEEFKDYYLKEKNKNDLEDIFTLGVECTTFDEALAKIGKTRETLEQEALEKDLSYEEYLKQIIDEECDEWVQIEFVFENSEYSDKKIDELKEFIIEGTEYSTYDQFLQSMLKTNETEFNKKIQDTAFRNEKNFLKILVVNKITA